MRVRSTFLFVLLGVALLGLVAIGLGHASAAARHRTRVEQAAAIRTMKASALPAGFTHVATGIGCDTGGACIASTGTPRAAARALAPYLGSPPDAVTCTQLGLNMPDSCDVYGHVDGVSVVLTSAANLGHLDRAHHRIVFAGSTTMIAPTTG